MDVPVKRTTPAQHNKQKWTFPRDGRPQHKHDKHKLFEGDPYSHPDARNNNLQTPLHVHFFDTLQTLH